MHVEMNAIAHASAVPASGPQLDNRRIAAALIDLAIVVGGAFVIGLAAGLSGVGEGGAGLTAVVLAWALYYYFACESSGGQTLGKKAMKLRVVRLDGGTAGMGDIGVRTILRLIDGLFLYLVGLVVMLATGKRRGRLGDLAARTKIVSADAAALPAEPGARSGADRHTDLEPAELWPRRGHGAGGPRPRPGEPGRARDAPVRPRRAAGCRACAGAGLSSLRRSRSSRLSRSRRSRSLRLSRLRRSRSLRLSRSRRSRSLRLSRLRRSRSLRLSRLRRSRSSSLSRNR